MRDPVINSWFPVRETRPGEAQVTQLVTDKMRSEPGYHQPLPPSTGSLGLELLLESGLKVTELGERPSELMGKEELLASLREALLRLNSLAARLCRLRVSKSSRDEFHEFRLCFTF